MEKENTYFIKLNAEYLAKWILYVFIFVSAGYLFSFLENLSYESGKISISYVLYYLAVAARLLIAYCFLKLATVEKFSKSAFFIVLHSLFTVFSNFIINNTFSSLIFVVLFSITQFILDMYGGYLAYRGFTNLLTGLNDPLAKSWKIRWYTVVIINFLLLIGSLISEVFINNLEKKSFFVVSWFSVVAIAVIIAQIYLLVILYKTSDFFKKVNV